VVRWSCRPLVAVRFSYGDPPGSGQGRAAAVHSPLAKHQVEGLQDGSQQCGDGELAEVFIGASSSRAASGRAKDIAGEEFL
jgi:hypothetical protein